MAGPDASFCFGDRYQTAGAAFQGASDAEVQGALGEARLRAGRCPIPEISQAVDRGVAPQTGIMDRLGRKSRMQSKLVSKPGETRVWIAVLKTGEEVKTSLLKLAAREGIENASFVALGAFEKATIAYFDWPERKYKNIPVAE